MRAICIVGGLMIVFLWAGISGAQPFRGGLPACVRQLNTCNANLETCQTDLEECEAAVFPGDGLDGPALSYTDNGNGTFMDNNTLLTWEKKTPWAVSTTWTIRIRGTTPSRSFLLCSTLPPVLQAIVTGVSRMLRNYTVLWTMADFLTLFPVSQA